MNIHAAYTTSIWPAALTILCKPGSPDDVVCCGNLYSSESRHSIL